MRKAQASSLPFFNHYFALNRLESVMEKFFAFSWHGGSRRRVMSIAPQNFCSPFARCSFQYCPLCVLLFMLMEAYWVGETFTGKPCSSHCILTLRELGQELQTTPYSCHQIDESCRTMEVNIVNYKISLALTLDFRISSPQSDAFEHKYHDKKNTGFPSQERIPCAANMSLRSAGPY
jgi:hypothetical protein